MLTHNLNGASLLETLTFSFFIKHFYSLISIFKRGSLILGYLLSCGPCQFAYSLGLTERQKCCWWLLTGLVVLLFSRSSHVRLCATPWTVARQVPLSMGFSRQEYWNGLLFPCLGDLPNSGIEPASLALAGGFFTTGYLLSCGAWQFAYSLGLTERQNVADGC